MVQELSGKTIPDELYNLTQLAEVAAKLSSSLSKTNYTSTTHPQSNDGGPNNDAVADVVGIAKQHFDLDNSQKTFLSVGLETSAPIPETIPPQQQAIPITNKLLDYSNFTTTCYLNKSTKITPIPSVITDNNYHYASLNDSAGAGVGAGSDSIVDVNGVSVSSGIYSDTSNSSDLDDKTFFSSTKKKWKSEWEKNKCRNNINTNSNNFNNTNNIINDSSISLSYHKDNVYTILSDKKINDKNASTNSPIYINYIAPKIIPSVTTTYCDQQQVLYQQSSQHHQRQQQEQHLQQLQHYQQEQSLRHFSPHQVALEQSKRIEPADQTLRHRYEDDVSSVDDAELRRNSITSSDDDSKYGYTHKIFDRTKSRTITSSESSSNDESENNSNKSNCDEVSRRGDNKGGNGTAEEGSYSCPECGKKYSTSSNLARHRQTHRSLQDKKARRCPHCNKVYVSMPAYAMHVRTHNQGCQCPHCYKCFSRPWLLQGHLRTHTGEKPFKCTVCFKAFADKSNLRAHVQTHSNTKPHSCKRCGKSFALKSYLYKHEESSCMKNHKEKDDKEKSKSPVIRTRTPKKDLRAEHVSSPSKRSSSDISSKKLSIRDKIREVLEENSKKTNQMNASATSNRISVIRTVSNNDRVSPYHPKPKDDDMQQSSGCAGINQYAISV